MQSINNFDKDQFVDLFGNIFENSSWIAECTFKKKPFMDFDDLINKMIDVFKFCKKEDQLNILLNHPDLADKVKISDLTKYSLEEQNKSGLNQCTESEFKEFKYLNNIYKDKFGFPFILSVAGKNKNEILNNFKERIIIKKDKEFNEALQQVIKIALSRLNSLRSKIS